MITNILSPFYGSQSISVMYELKNQIVRKGLCATELSLNREEVTKAGRLKVSEKINSN